MVVDPQNDATVTITVHARPTTTWPTTTEHGPASEQVAADSIVNRIDRVAPESADLIRSPTQAGPEHIAAGGDGLFITIPNNNSGKIILDEPGSEKDVHFGVGLPSDGAVKDAVIAHDGTVTYLNSETTSAMSKQSLSGQHRPDADRGR